MNVGLPMELVKQIDRQLRHEPAIRSRAEFVRRAVERFLEDRPSKPAS